MGRTREAPEALGNLLSIEADLYGGSSYQQLVLTIVGTWHRQGLGWKHRADFFRLNRSGVINPKICRLVVRARGRCLNPNPTFEG